MSKISSDKVQSIIKFNESYKGYYDDNVDRQKRLKILVEKHGVDTTAAAAGMTTSTLVQYIRVKTVPAINENSVLKAERWSKYYERK
jgi:hypothetical protein